MSSKNELVCGKTVKYIMDGRGVCKYIRYYCNKKDCDNCRPTLLGKLQEEAKAMLYGVESFYTITLPNESSRGFTNKIRGRNYLCMPQDGEKIFLVDTAIDYKGQEATRMNRYDALSLVTKEENIFTVGGNRSTGGDWRLTPKPEEKESKYQGSVIFRLLVPFFDPPHDDKSKLYLLDNFRAASVIWRNGVLDPNNDEQVQAFVDHKVSVYAEMAIREGFRYNENKSYVRAEEKERSEIANWIGASVDGNVHYFNDHSRREIQAISPQLIPIITGNTGIKNWRLELDKKRYPHWFVSDEDQAIFDMALKAAK